MFVIPKVTFLLTLKIFHVLNININESRYRILRKEGKVTTTIKPAATIAIRKHESQILACISNGNHRYIYIDEELQTKN